MGIGSGTGGGKFALSDFSFDSPKFHEGIFATGIITPGGLFRLTDGAAGQVMYAAPKSKEESKVSLPYELFHWRCGHVGKDTVERTAQVSGVALKGAQNGEACDPCRRGKAVAQPFRSSARIVRSEVCAEILHLDVVILSHPTFDGMKYAVIFTDCASDLKKIALLKAKSELYDAFYSYLRWSERQTGNKLKTVRLDGELYASAQFKALRAKEGFNVKLTNRGKSNMNPVAERANRTIETMARCMLIDGRCPPYLAGKAMVAACYVHNHLHSTRIGTSPLAKFSGKATTVHQLRRLFCKCWFMPSNKAKSKDGERGSLGVFMGYDEDRRSWLVFDLATKKFITSRDVTFDEMQRGWPSNWSRKQAERGEVSYPDLLSDVDPLVSSLGNREEVKTQATPGVDGHQDEKDVSVVEDELLSQGTPTPSEMPRLEAPTSEEYFRDEKTAVLEDFHSPPSCFEDDLNDGDDESVTPRYPQRNRVQSLAGVESAISQGHVFSVTINIGARKAIEIPRWKAAMDKHMHQVLSKGVYSVVPRSAVGQDGNVISSRWVFTEENPAAQDHGQKDKCKARWVVRGFSQQRYVDYWDTWSPTIRLCSFRFLFCLAARCGFTVRHVDVRAAFYNATLKESIFAELPTGYEQAGKVAQLHKAVPGLKQAGREWYFTLNKIVSGAGWVRCDYDPSFYIKWFKKGFALVGVHVDDCLCAGSPRAGDDFVSLLASHFEIKDLGEARFALGIDIVKFSDGFGLHMGTYLTQMLKRYGMEDCHAVSSPGIKERPQNLSKTSGLTRFTLDELKGSLRWPTNCVRPDTAADICMLSKCVTKDPEFAYCRVARLFRYYKGTLYFGLRFRAAEGPIFPLNFHGWPDGNWGGCPYTGRSQGGHFIQLGKQVFDYQAKRQDCVSTSSTESELREMKDILRKFRWLLSVCAQFRFPVKKPIEIYEDNTAAILLSTTNVLSKKLSHTEISMKYINEQMETGEFKAVRVGTKDQLADILTKPLPTSTFLHLRSKVVSEIVQPIQGSVALVFAQPFGKCGDGPPRLNIIPGEPDGHCHVLRDGDLICKHQARVGDLLCPLHTKVAEGRHCRGRTPKRECRSVSVAANGYCSHHQAQAIYQPGSATQVLALQVDARATESKSRANACSNCRAVGHLVDQCSSPCRRVGHGDHVSRLCPIFATRFPLPEEKEGKYVRARAARSSATPQVPMSSSGSSSTSSPPRSSSSSPLASSTQGSMGQSSSSATNTINSEGLENLSPSDLFTALAELFGKLALLSKKH